MNGGVSHIDTFDYKPRWPGDMARKSTSVSSRRLQVNRGPSCSRRSSQATRRVRSLGEQRFSAHGRVRRRVGLLMAMASKTNVHGPPAICKTPVSSCRAFHPLAHDLVWLGNLNDNLPTFVRAADPRGLPYNATGNFSQGFLPAAHQARLSPNSASNRQSATAERDRHKADYAAQRNGWASAFA